MAAPATGRDEDQAVSGGPLEVLASYHLRRAFGIFGSDFATEMEGTERRTLIDLLVRIKRPQSAQ